MTHQRSDSSKVIYSLAGSHDNENYANSSAIQRRMDNNEPANFYADITAAKKRRKEPDGAEVEMLENELYGM
ncbi:hypothetical protein EB796_012171 [Bugula neritina]|uniref:Uncharacterized protein n=1 Tax=Bugula neritina TaxID=10212 RepID=A0A7J7JUT8_BUGNE|nr:hypothetical protein EB796_012171 [Bugula neritina]